MKVTKNSNGVYGPPEVIYDDEVESSGGLRIELPNTDGSYVIEISDASEDYDMPRLQIRSAGRTTKALLVRPQVSNSILIFVEELG